MESNILEPAINITDITAESDYINSYAKQEIEPGR